MFHLMELEFQVDRTLMESEFQVDVTLIDFEWLGCFFLATNLLNSYHWTNLNSLCELFVGVKLFQSLELLLTVGGILLTAT